MHSVPLPRIEKQALGVLLVLASTAAFALGPTAAKLALYSGSNTLTVVTLRSAIGAVLMAGLIALLRQGFCLDPRSWRPCLACGVFGGLTVYAFIAAVGYVPVNAAVLVFFAHPIGVAAIAWWSGDERLTATRLFLALAALAGLALALGPGVGELAPAGIALAALAAAAMCGMVLCSARAQEHATSAQVNFYVTAATGAVCAVPTATLGAWALPSDATGWLGILGAGVGIGFGLLLFFAALRHISAVRATMLSNTEPLLSILFAAAVLGERLDPLQWAGVAVTICALVLFEAVGRGSGAGG